MTAREAIVHLLQPGVSNRLIEFSLTLSSTTASALCSQRPHACGCLIERSPAGWTDWSEAVAASQPGVVGSWLIRL